MVKRIFSRSHPKAAQGVILPQAVRQRIWYVMEQCDPYDYQGFDRMPLRYEPLSLQLKREHGWNELRAYQGRSEWEALTTTEDFILRGVPRFVLDSCELFYDLLVEGDYSPSLFQSKINVVMQDADLPWRMLDGRFLQVDSVWLEEDIHAKLAELLSVQGYEGPLAEFQQARRDLSTGDYKGAISQANLALESTIKSILGVESLKPGALYRKIIDAGLVPEYHEGFLKAFEEHILRSVAETRNFEKGVGHGQGRDVNDPPQSLAELAISLSGVLILYLMKRHIEPTGISEEPQSEDELTAEDLPF